MNLCELRFTSTRVGKTFRVILGRVFDQAGQAQTAEELVRLIDLSGRALTRLADLESRQRELAKDELDNAITQAVQEVVEEMRSDGRMKL